jgi:hypothetical protein
VIAKVEPSLKGDPVKLPVYLELFKREFVEDTRTFAFNVAPSAPGELTLVGHIEFEEHKRALGEFFKRLGLDVIDKTELLPGETLGNKRFALVTAPRTFVYDRTTGRIERLDRVRARRPRLRPQGRRQRAVFVPRARRLRRLHRGVGAAADRRRGAERTPERGRRFAIAPRSHRAGHRGGAKISRHPVRLGRGKQGRHRLLGLIRQAFKAASIVMPRDADQQFLVGRLVGTRWYTLGLRRGDTLYFLGRRGTISHTALYLGEGKFIEATEPVVKISSFNPKTRITRRSASNHSASRSA